MDEKFTALFQPTVAEKIQKNTLRAPFPVLIGVRVESSAPGQVVCTLAVEEKHFSTVGAIHGGVVAALVDHTLSLAVYPLVEPGKWVATTEFKLNYLRAVQAGELRATGTVVSLGKMLAVVQVEVKNGDDLVAIAQGTLAIRDPLPQKP